MQFDGLKGLSLVDRELVLAVSKHVDDPTKLRSLNWTNVVGSRVVKQLLNTAQS